MKIDKEALLVFCIQLMENKLQQIQNAINGYLKDLSSETKSSAGDKHETGRAMLQLEMEKLGKQYQTVLLQKELLYKMEVPFKSIAQIGSIVLVNGDYYFLASSIGQVRFGAKTILVISINAPIGKLLIGKQQGATFAFNGKQYTVEEVF